MKRYAPHDGVMVEMPGALYIEHTDHAAFVERVREALEVLEFDRTSGVNLYEAIHAIDDARFKLRAALLEVCNG